MRETKNLNFQISRLKQHEDVVQFQQAVTQHVTLPLQIGNQYILDDNQEMKFLLFLLGVTTFTYCKQAVKAEDLSTLDQIKAKAKQLYQEFDQNRDGHIAFDEITQQIKDKLGLEDKQKKDEVDEDKSYIRQFYQKIFTGKNSKSKLNEKDFEQLFIKHYKQIKQKESNTKLKNPKRQSSTLQKKAKDLYDKFDKNKDGSVSLDQLKEGIKGGLFFSQQKVEQSSMGDYINDLYQKYVKPDRKNRDSFTKQDFYQILNQNQDKSILQKVKDKANKVYQALDKNRDESISLDQLKGGLAQLLGFESEQEISNQKTLKQRANQLYEKYIKPDSKNMKGLTKQNILDIIKENMESAKDTISDAAGKVKDKISPQPKNLDQVIEVIMDSAVQLKETISDKITQAKQVLQDKKSNINLQDIKKKSGQLYDMLDVDKDKSISLQQIIEGIKYKFNINTDVVKGQNSLVSYIKDLYQKYIQTDKLKQFKLNKQEFIECIDGWGKKLGIPKNKKKAEQL